MKTFLLITTFFLSLGTFAQKSDKNDTLKVKTNAVCDMCKERIEDGLRFEKGVKYSVLNLEDKFLTVIYNRKKTNPETLQKAVAALGHDAGTVKANAKKQAELPACCKPGSTCDH